MGLSFASAQAHIRLPYDAQKGKTSKRKSHHTTIKSNVVCRGEEKEYTVPMPSSLSNIYLANRISSTLPRDKDGKVLSWDWIEGEVQTDTFGKEYNVYPRLKGVLESPKITIDTENVSAPYQELFRQFPAQRCHIEGYGPACWSTRPGKTYEESILVGVVGAEVRKVIPATGYTFREVKKFSARSAREARFYASILRKPDALEYVRMLQARGYTVRDKYAQHLGVSLPGDITYRCVRRADGNNVRVPFCYEDELERRIQSKELYLLPVNARQRQNAEIRKEARRVSQEGYEENKAERTAKAKKKRSAARAAEHRLRLQKASLAQGE